MGRPKKQIEGTIISIDDTPPELPKKKKELSEKQKENLRKGMEALKERRRKLMEDEDIIPDVKEVVKEIIPETVLPVIKEVKEIKSRVPRVKPNYLTKDDFNAFKNDLLNQLRPVEKIVEKEKIIDKIIEKPIDRVVVERLSGSALLDEIFFKRK